MSVITVLIVAISVTGLLVAAVRAIMTHALEHDHSFRTDLNGSADIVTPPGTGGTP